MPWMQWESQENTETFHRWFLTGHTAAILKEMPAMISDTSRSSNSQENAPHYRIVWPACEGPRINMALKVVGMGANYRLT